MKSSKLVFLGLFVVLMTGTFVFAGLGEPVEIYAEDSDEDLVSSIEERIKSQGVENVVTDEALIGQLTKRLKENPSFAKVLNGDDVAKAAFLMGKGIEASQSENYEISYEKGMLKIETFAGDISLGAVTISEDSLSTVESIARYGTIYNAVTGDVYQKNAMVGVDYKVGPNGMAISADGMILVGGAVVTSGELKKTGDGEWELSNGADGPAKIDFSKLEEGVKIKVTGDVKFMRGGIGMIDEYDGEGVTIEKKGDMVSIKGKFFSAVGDDMLFYDGEVLWGDDKGKEVAKASQGTKIEMRRISEDSSEDGLGFSSVHTSIDVKKGSLNLVSNPEDAPEGEPYLALSQNAMRIDNLNDGSVNVKINDETLSKVDIGEVSGDGEVKIETPDGSVTYRADMDFSATGDVSDFPEVNYKLDDGHTVVLDTSSATGCSFNLCSDCKEVGAAYSRLRNHLEERTQDVLGRFNAKLSKGTRIVDAYTSNGVEVFRTNEGETFMVDLNGEGVWYKSSEDDGFKMMKMGVDGKLGLVEASTGKALGGMMFDEAIAAKEGTIPQGAVSITPKVDQAMRGRVWALGQEDAGDILVRDPMTKGAGERFVYNSKTGMYDLKTGYSGSKQSYTPKEFQEFMEGKQVDVVPYKYEGYDNSKAGASFKVKDSNGDIVGSIERGNLFNEYKVTGPNGEKVGSYMSLDDAKSAFESSGLHDIGQKPVSSYSDGWDFLGPSDFPDRQNGFIQPVRPSGGILPSYEYDDISDPKAGTIINVKDSNGNIVGNIDRGVFDQSYKVTDVQGNKIGSYLSLDDAKQAFEASRRTSTNIIQSVTPSGSSAPGTSDNGAGGGSSSNILSNIMSIYERPYSIKPDWKNDADPAKSGSNVPLINKDGRTVGRAVQSSLFSKVKVYTPLGSLYGTYDDWEAAEKAAQALPYVK